MSKWHAIRTLPGAQMPQRTFAVEPNTLDKDGKPRGKGYRIVPSLNPNESAIERALSDAGITHYMPAEFKVIQSRTKARLYTLRRFSLCPGYVFVYGVTDWFSLLGSDDRNGVPGVGGVVSIHGVPLPIDIADILRLRTHEATSHAKAERDVSLLNNQASAKGLKEAAKALAVSKRRFAAGNRVKVLWGSAVGREAVIIGWEDSQIKALVEKLDGAETVTIPHDAVRMVA